MVDMLSFTAGTPPEDDPTFNPQDIPKELDIFYRNEADFLPEGKTFAELTPEEERRLKSQYRFSPLRPGLYQSITGFRNSV